LLRHCQEGHDGFLTDFHEKGIFQKSLNAAFLSILLQIAGANNIMNIRHISLVGSVYQILAKVLTLRLRKVVGRVVSPNQHAFIYSRQILNTSLTANERIDFYLKLNHLGVHCKLNIDKAYNYVSWSFLMATLEKMDFQANGGVRCIFVYLKFTILCWLMVKLQGFSLAPGCVKEIHYLLI